MKVEYRDISKELDLVEFVRDGLTKEAKKSLGITEGNIFRRKPMQLPLPNYYILTSLQMQWRGIRHTFGVEGKMTVEEDHGNE